MKYHKLLNDNIQLPQPFFNEIDRGMLFASKLVKLPIGKYVYDQSNQSSYTPSLQMQISTGIPDAVFSSKIIQEAGFGHDLPKAYMKSNFGNKYHIRAAFDGVYADNHGLYLIEHKAILIDDFDPYSAFIQKSISQILFYARMFHIEAFENQKRKNFTFSIRNYKTGKTTRKSVEVKGKKIIPCLIVTTPKKVYYVDLSRAYTEYSPTVYQFYAVKAAHIAHIYQTQSWSAYQNMTPDQKNRANNYIFELNKLRTYLQWEALM